MRVKVTMDPDGAIGQHDGANLGDQRDHIHVPCLKLQKNVIDLTNDREPALGSKVQSLPNSAGASRKSMDPRLWGTLPKELLLLVLARLPVHKINYLRCLSKQWHRDLGATVESEFSSEFNQLCDQSHPNMAAVISYAGYSSQFLVRIIDIKTHTWQYAYHFRLRDSGKTPSTGSISGENLMPVWTMMDACDSGLVCFVSNWTHTKANSLCIVVMNPMTRVQRALPPLKRSLFTVPPRMVHVQVDSEAQYYKVFVAGYIGDQLRVEIYDSSLRQWTAGAPSLGFILGRAHMWRKVCKTCTFSLFSTTPCVFNSEDGHLELYNANNPPMRSSMLSIAHNRDFVHTWYWDIHTNISVLSYALHGDHMYVLQLEMHTDANHISTQAFCIREYHTENSGKDWTYLKTHPCPAFVEHGKMRLGIMKLHACEGTLMVLAGGSKRDFWLLDLSTEEWHKLPGKLTGTDKNHHSFLCRARWNMIL